MNSFGHIFYFLLLASSSYAKLKNYVERPSDQAIVSDYNYGLYDKEIDYTRFSGRVTDKTDDNKIFKIQVENDNTRFYRRGDLVQFQVNELNEKEKTCEGTVRSTEPFHFTIEVKNLHYCYPSQSYFRRGTILAFYSKVLAQRVLEASHYRQSLIEQKDDYLKQMLQTNRFLWSFEQQRAKVASEYDKKIGQIRLEKKVALDDLYEKKEDYLKLQATLNQKIENIKEALKFYEVQRQELFFDRWHMDQDLGHPVGKRPQPSKKAESQRKRDKVF